MAAPPQGVAVKSLRLLVHRDGINYKLAHLGWSNKDASLYVVPYLPQGGRAHVGQMKIPGPGEGPSTFDYSYGAEGTDPKLSLHESGRCHATVTGGKAGPLWGRNLFDPEGGHVATVSCFNLAGLPKVKDLRGPPRFDMCLLSNDPTFTAVHVPLFVCPDEAACASHGAWISLQREGRPQPLLIGIGGRTTVEPPENQSPGVLVFAGWGPGDDPRPLTGVFTITSPTPPS